MLLWDAAACHCLHVHLEVGAARDAFLLCGVALVTWTSPSTLYIGVLIVVDWYTLTMRIIIFRMVSQAAESGFDKWIAANRR